MKFIDKIVQNENIEILNTPKFISQVLLGMIIPLGLFKNIFESDRFEGNLGMFVDHSHIITNAYYEAIYILDITSELCQIGMISLVIASIISIY